MSIRFREFFDVAVRLAESSKEADQRSAISRAYYSTLHGTLAALPEDRRSNQDFSGSSHEAVIAAAKGYGNSVPPLPGRGAAIRIADKLSRLKAKRRKADYRLDDDIDLAYTRQALAEAEAALKDCAEWVAHREAAMD